MRPTPPSPTPSIDDPIELLLACHDRIRRFAKLLIRLRDHLAAMPAGAAPDKQARDAATSILRYFDIAAPLHHEDEELDLFPALRALGKPALSAAIDVLDAQHAPLAAAWQALRPWLLAVADGQAHPAPGGVGAFAEAYAEHARCEEAQIYPDAAALSPQQITRISEAMVRRRTENR